MPRIILFIFLILFCQPLWAWDQSLKIMAGRGKSANTLNWQNVTFSDKGFVMGFEYSNSLADKSKFVWGAGLLLNYSVYGGLGYDLGPLRLLGNYGYGLTNVSAPHDSNGPNKENMGAIYGGSVDFRLDRSVGFSCNILSNQTYLGGISIHF